MTQLHRRPVRSGSGACRARRIVLLLAVGLATLAAPSSAQNQEAPSPEPISFQELSGQRIRVLEAGASDAALEGILRGVRGDTAFIRRDAPYGTEPLMRVLLSRKTVVERPVAVHRRGRSALIGMVAGAGIGAFGPRPSTGRSWCGNADPSAKPSSRRSRGSSARWNRGRPGDKRSREERGSGSSAAWR